MYAITKQMAQQITVEVDAMQDEGLLTAAQADIIRELQQARQAAHEQRTTFRAQRANTADAGNVNAATPAKDTVAV